MVADVLFPIEASRFRETWKFMHHINCFYLYLNFGGFGRK